MHAISIMEIAWRSHGDRTQARVKSHRHVVGAHVPAAKSNRAPRLAARRPRSSSVRPGPDETARDARARGVCRPGPLLNPPRDAYDVMIAHATRANGIQGRAGRAGRGGSRIGGRGRLRWGEWLSRGVVPASAPALPRALSGGGGCWLRGSEPLRSHGSSGGVEVAGAAPSWLESCAELC